MESEITETNIITLVHTFYEKVARDPLLGPVFHEHVGQSHTEWAPHLTKMVDFWSTVLLKSGRYEGRPPLAHLKIKELDDSHFERWLNLFELTCREIYVRPIAENLIERAHLIKGGLSRAIVLARAGQK